MDGNWQLDSSQGPPVRSYFEPHPQPASQFTQPVGQSVLHSASAGYGQSQFLQAPIHESFYALRSRTDLARASASRGIPQIQPHDDEGEYGLDEFDRQVLSMSELPTSHPQSTRRLSLAQAQAQAQPTVRPGFQGSAQEALESVFQPVHGHLHSDFTPNHQLAGPGYFLPSQKTYQQEPSPLTTSTTIREPGHGQRDLQARLQPGTVPLYTASYAYQHALSPATPPVTRRSSDVGSLSPSEGVSLRRQSRSQIPPRRKTLSMFSSQEAPLANQPAVEATGTPPVVNGIQLISPRQALSDNLFYQSIFPYPVFNAVQSKCFESAYESSDNLVVSAPTGSGKTAIFELAICKLIKEKGLGNIKIVYQAPTKALCSERARDWAKKFSTLNLKCAELTGDTSQAQMRRVGSASIIVTTPEKWDSITRKWHDHRKLLQLVALFLIDEVHILKDIRGATLEAVVSRMKSISTDVRFVALSATIPNSEDIATWLGRNVESQHLPARRETFGEEFRPVKLVRHVVGFEKRQNDHAFDKKLDTKLPALLAEHTEGKPILVFCFTRKSCENTANLLAEWWRSLPNDKKPWHKPLGSIRIVGRELHDLVPVGVAFHHAGLLPQDRQAIEQAFLKGDLSVICCTSTLAVGVNLPCHTVVLKGTVTYQNDAIHELSDLEALQMLGRAGRPQFDDSANAIILTSSDQKERYLRMVSGEEILESTLHLNLIEHLNSEVGLRTITDMDSAKKWLAGTFLSVRMRKNPDYYRLAEGITTAQDTDSRLEEICSRNIKVLQAYKIITSDQVIRQTEYGGAMSRYMIEFNTMKLLLDLPRALGMEQLLNNLAKANEFREFKFKPADGQIFREVNKSPFILYQIEENVTKTWHKVSLVVQLHLGGADYPDVSEGQKHRQQLRLEKKGIFERLRRLARCVAECKGHDGDSFSTKTALELYRSLAAGAWEGRPSELLQIPSIGPVCMRKLVSQGVKTVKDLVHKDPGEIAGILGRNPTFGKALSDTLKGFPLLDFDLAIPSQKYTLATSGEAISLPLVATLRCLNETGLPLWYDKVPSVTFVAETTAGLLVYFWRGYLDKIQDCTGLELPFSAELVAQTERVVCHFSCEEIVGTIVSKSLDHTVPASAFKKLKHRIPHHVEPVPQTKPDNSDKKDVTVSRKLVHTIDSSLSDDDLDDADAIQAAAAFDEPTKESRNSQNGSRESHSQNTIQSNYSDGEFPMIEDILAAVVPQNQPAMSPAQSGGPKIPRTFGDAAEEEALGDATEKDPVKLPNGKWQCNHACTGGAPTKAGKRCTHRCCLEGLDKPRKVKPKEPKEPKVIEPKKRKADGSIDQDMKKKKAATGGSDESATGSGKACKKRKPSQQSASEHSRTEEDASKFDPAESSGIGDDYDDYFPDLAGLASRKTNDKACGASGTHSGKSSASPLPDDYLPSAPPATTTDYGDLDDDFDDDFDMDFDTTSGGGQLLTDHGNVHVVKKTVDTGRAFKPNGKDPMLPDFTARPAPPGETTDSMDSLSPVSYKVALQEAARLCDIDSQALSLKHNVDTPAPDDLIFQPFDESSSDLAYINDTKPEEEKAVIQQSPGTLVLGGNFAGFAERGGSSSGIESTKNEKQEEDPAWVADFDQEFIDSFRGFVSFI